VITWDKVRQNGNGYGRESAMPTLKEMYDLAVEQFGEDSKVAQALKEQMEAFEKPSSAERHFIAGGRPFDNGASEEE